VSGIKHQSANNRGWFAEAVTAFVTSTKLSYVESGLYWD